MQGDSRNEAGATGSHEDDSAQSLADLRAARKPKRRRRIWIPIVIVVALVVAAGAAYLVYESSQSDTETAATPTDTGVALPQNPSLKMVVEEGTLYVENDGNVTMSDVEVRDAAGTVVCAMGVISPGDRQPCEEAGGAQDLTVFGDGPQGQPVQAGLQ